jgi:hypothetical protein
LSISDAQADTPRGLLKDADPDIPILKEAKSEYVGREFSTVVNRHLRSEPCRVQAVCLLARQAPRALLAQCGCPKAHLNPTSLAEPMAAPPHPSRKTDMGQMDENKKVFDDRAHVQRDASEMSS